MATFFSIYMIKKYINFNINREKKWASGHGLFFTKNLRRNYTHYNEEK